MTKGDLVTVYPHGSEELGWRARVEICSTNQRSIAIGFDTVPPFLNTSQGVTMHMKTGKIVMLLSREAIGGKPWGPWVEIFGGGHYEIEEA
jgi:hypothetical protein